MTGDSEPVEDLTAAHPTAVLDDVVDRLRVGGDLLQDAGSLGEVELEEVDRMAEAAHVERHLELVVGPRRPLPVLVGLIQQALDVGGCRRVLEARPAPAHFTN